MDCLVLIGSAVQSHITNELVLKALNSNNTIVEINPASVVLTNNNKVERLIGDLDDVIPRLIKVLKEK